MNAKRKVSFLLALALVAGLGGGMLLSRGIADNNPSMVIPKEMTSYSGVVKRVLPAVVSVRVTAAKTAQVRGQREDMLPNMQNLPEGIREQLQEQLQQQGDEPRPRPGQFGSGAIIDPKGIVVTNNHVVAGATAVMVTLHDGRSYPSKSIVTDPKTDLAIVKLDTKETLPYLELGDSDAMEIGD